MSNTDIIEIDIPRNPSTKNGEFDLSISDNSGINVCNLERSEINYGQIIKMLKRIRNEWDTTSSPFIFSKDFTERLDKLLPFFGKPFENSLKLYLQQKICTNFSSLAYSWEQETKKEEQTRYENLLSEFQKEYEKYGRYLEGNKTDVSDLFRFIARQVCKISYEDFLIEIAPTNSFKIKLSFKDNFLMVISKPLHSFEELKDNEVVFSLFENKRCLVSNATNIVDLVNGINASLDKK